MNDTDETETSTQFILTLVCDNDAFAEDIHAEVTRILRRLAERLEADRYDAGTLADINGNTVGSFAFLPRSSR